MDTYENNWASCLALMPRMRLLHLLILSSRLLLKGKNNLKVTVKIASSLWSTGIIFCKPLLHPESVYACPNETVTFTCHGSDTVSIQWELDMYIDEGAQITFTSIQPVGSQNMVYMDMISANLSEVTKVDGSQVANITTTLTIITNGLLNKTNISCLTPNDDNDIVKSSSIFYFAGLLYY